MKFDLPKEQSSIIKVIGVGGGGGNAVNHMYKLGITGVNFVICNTDGQALDNSPVPNKIQLGSNLTEGMGAGSLPEVGKEAAEESKEAIQKILSTNTKMVFVTAGMGGGTGTGGAPVIARMAREMGILTVGIVTIPFNFEGKRRILQAQEGIQELKQNVDSLLIICNDKLKDVFGNLTLSEAFAHADNVVTIAAKGIAEIITVHGYVNVDFKDVKKVLTDSGVSIMGSATAEGDNRAVRAVEMALTSPLLNDNNIIGAKDILLNITSGTTEVTMDEIGVITNYIQEEAGLSADMIWGNGTDEALGDKLSVTIIATGFKTSQELNVEKPAAQKIVRHLDEEIPDAVEPEKDNVVATEVSEPVFKKAGETDEVQVTLPFEESKETPVFKLDATKSIEQPEMRNTEIDDETEEQLTRKSEERIKRLKDLSMKLRTPSGVSDLENEPAYVRRNVDLEDVPHSSDNEMSRYTISDDSEKTDDCDEEDKKDSNAQIRPNNNSFLHDNVD